MTKLIASPHGVTLPYSSIFDVNLRHQSKRPTQSKPSSYFWDRATQSSASHAATEDDVHTVDEALDNISFLSDNENEKHASPIVAGNRIRKHLRLKLRKIAFKAFIPKADGTGKKDNVVRTTEILSLQEKGKPLQQNGLSDLGDSTPLSIFKSWKIKSRGGGSQLQKMVAVVKRRISASSPSHVKPRTWEEYRFLYANEEIDVHNPPLPPMEPANDGEKPTAFQSRFFAAPEPSNSQVRRLVLNRLGIFGKKGYDPTEDGAVVAKARYALGDQLMELGQAPTSLDIPWESRNSHDSDGYDENALEGRVAPNPSLPPETLEQHPVFRRIVQKCRELFQVSLGILSILDDERMIFLAESGLDTMPQIVGMRDAARDLTYCSHTVLSGRKGFTVLDTHKDWRFENGPLTQNLGVRFYAGVPVMAPNLDGSPEAEHNSCPIGTLCLIDWEPRESFDSEDRMKLVYLSEYARREIEKWFAKKMECKMDFLAASQENWKQELTRIDSAASDAVFSAGPEILSDPSHLIVPDESPRTCRPSESSNSLSSRLSPIHRSIRSPTKTGPGIFEDVNMAVKPNMRKVFDLATKLVAETLDLSLVYLSAAVPYDESTQLGRTIIIAGHNIPVPAPVFDTGLHLKALRTPEGGLLYQNPSIEESEKDGLQPKSTTPDSSSAYASAMLLAVSPEAHPNAGGYILAGYTDDPKRVFGAEDVSYMKQFAQELSRYTSKLRF